MLIGQFHWQTRILNYFLNYPIGQLSIFSASALPSPSTIMILTGTEKCPLAVNESHWQEWPLGGIPAGIFLGTAGN